MDLIFHLELKQSLMHDEIIEAVHQNNYVIVEQNHNHEI